MIESAQTEADAGNYLEAERLYKKALEAAEKLGPKDHRSVDALEKLGSFYYGLCRYDDALACYKRALELRDKEKPQRSLEEKFVDHRPFGDDQLEEHYGRLSNMCDIAKCYVVLKDYSAASQVLKELSSKLSLSGADKNAATKSTPCYQAEYISYDLRRLTAFIARAEGRFDEAEKIYKEFANSEHGYYGESHCRAMMNLAVLYDDKGDHAAANKMYSRALILGSPTENRGDLFNDITKKGLEISTNKVGPGEGLSTMALGMSEQAAVDFVIVEKVSVNPQLSPIVLKELGAVMLECGRLKQAETLLKRSHDIYESLLKDKKEKNYEVEAEQAQLIVDLVKVYRRTSREGEAVKLEKELRARYGQEELSRKRAYGEAI